jgi:hypothetical protein
VQDPASKRPQDGARCRAATPAAKPICKIPCPIFCSRNHAATARSYGITVSRALPLACPAQSSVVDLHNNHRNGLFANDRTDANTTPSPTPRTRAGSRSKSAIPKSAHWWILRLTGPIGGRRPPLRRPHITATTYTVRDAPVTLQYAPYDASPPPHLPSNSSLSKGLPTYRECYLLFEGICPITVQDQTAL